MPSARRRSLLGVTNKLRARAEKPSTWFSTNHPVELMRGERAGKATDGMSRREFFRAQYKPHGIVSLRPR
jgi:hypothetical protein